MKQEPALIFLHIPKTAGQTLGSIMNRQFSPKEVYDIHRYGMDVTKSVEEFIKLPENVKRNFKLIKGHYQFGLHKFLPQPSIYFTFLRDPVDRVISHYYYVLRTPNHPLNVILKTKGMDLDAYVLSGISNELNNGQTRMLSGMENLYGFGDCQANLLDVAKENLKNHSIISGIVEEFDKSLVLMKIELGWKYIYYYKHNVSKYRSSKNEISKSTLRNIEKYNELDIELYEYVKRLFTEAVNAKSELVNKELRKLRWQNCFYRPYIRFYHLTQLYDRIFKRLSRERIRNQIFAKKIG